MAVAKASRSKPLKTNSRNHVLDWSVEIVLHSESADIWLLIEPIVELWRRVADLVSLSRDAATTTIGANQPLHLCPL